MAFAFESVVNFEVLSGRNRPSRAVDMVEGVEEWAKIFPCHVCEVARCFERSIGQRSGNFAMVDSSAVTSQQMTK